MSSHETHRISKPVPGGRLPKEPDREPTPAKDLAARLESAGLPGPVAAAGNAAVGRLLEPRERSRLERAFGENFSQVRLRRDQAAADRLDATAFTAGEQIHLGADAPAPDSPPGQQLLAHELAHVVQQRRGESRPGEVSRAGDQFETEANRAAATALAGGQARIGAGGAPPAVQRQGKPPALDLAEAQKLAVMSVVMQSDVESVVAAWLRREWQAQSKGEKPFRTTPAVRQGLEMIFGNTPTGIAAIASDLTMQPQTPEELLHRIRGKLPKSLDANILTVIQKLPAAEGPKEEKIEPPELEKTDEASSAVLKEAVRRLLETRVGQELAQSGKKFILSKKGIPVIAIFAGGAVSYVAANDPELPSLPAIPLGDGVELQIDFKGRASDLPPLLRQMVGGGAVTPPQHPGEAAVRGSGAGAAPPETMIGVTLKGNTEQVGDFLRSAGQFFTAVGRAVKAGVITVGEAIWPELLATGVGAGIGALIGGALGGALGAGIGALIGAGAGLIGALGYRLIRWLTKKKG